MKLHKNDSKYTITMTKPQAMLAVCAQKTLTFNVMLPYSLRRIRDVSTAESTLPVALALFTSLI